MSNNPNESDPRNRIAEVAKQPHQLLIVLQELKTQIPAEELLNLLELALEDATGVTEALLEQALLTEIKILINKYLTADLDTKQTLREEILGLLDQVNNYYALEQLINLARESIALSQNDPLINLLQLAHSRAINQMMAE